MTCPYERVIGLSDDTSFNENESAMREKAKVEFPDVIVELEFPGVYI